MGKPKNILLLSNSEICYNPRLAKAADSFYEKGYDVDVFNPIVGMADTETYKNFIRGKKWDIVEYDISKRNKKSKINWLITGVLNKLFLFLYKNFNSKIGFRYIKNKGLIGFKKNKKHYDIIIIHLVDSLPFAVSLKNKYKNSILIYDSQEYFTGQYSNANSIDKRWVETAEAKYINDANIIIGTTNVMCEKIAEKYKLAKKPIRVRNLPYEKEENLTTKPNQPVRLVWHGMRIVFKNRRGLHILLNAVAQTKTNVEFYIQGLINDTERKKILDFAEKNNLQDKIIIIPPATPDKIVKSLKKYDIGIIGELPEEENQMFTSSNKLFEFISAGLAIIMPDVPGLRETADEYNSFNLYSPGDYKQLAEKIDYLAINQEKLTNEKKVSQNLANTEILWNNDYSKVFNLL